MSTAKTIRTLRIKAALTQGELAKKCGLKHRSWIAHYEAGRRTPSMRNARKLAKVLKVSVEQLME